MGRRRMPDPRARGIEEQQQGRVVWQGRIGDAPLRVDVLPSGRIFATWSLRGNERRAVVDSVQQLEQRVLFQLMLGAGPQQDTIARDVISAVERGTEGMPDPALSQAPKRKKRPGGRQGPPRSRRRR